MSTPPDENVQLLADGSLHRDDGTEEDDIIAVVDRPPMAYADSLQPIAPDQTRLDEFRRTLQRWPKSLWITAQPWMIDPL